MATEPPVIDDGEWPDFERSRLAGPGGALAVRIGGPTDGVPIFFAHSILTSSAIWRRPAQRLADLGYRVICADTRGHGGSDPSPSPYAMSDLVADVTAILDGLGVDRVHYVGVSLGGMTGLGLAISRPSRLESLCVLAARADAPPKFRSGWDDRIELVRGAGTAALADPTAERWFAPAALHANAEMHDRLLACIGATSVEGFIGCARAIQGLDYLELVSGIRTPTSLLIGGDDEALLEPMRELSVRIPDARIEVIEAAGHLPQLDRPEATQAALHRHFQAQRLLAAT